MCFSTRLYSSIPRRQSSIVDLHHLLVAFVILYKSQTEKPKKFSQNGLWAQCKSAQKMHNNVSSTYKTIKHWDYNLWRQLWLLLEGKYLWSVTLLECYSTTKSFEDVLDDSLIHASNSLSFILHTKWQCNRVI